ncbi:MAG: D-glycero-beta-D-manno-heptose 1-phosphate adenylyltransferase [Desulfurobacterium sp.]|nr:MAG: D-glycero-beta-D-manno-heptose 1-phosphate adenylyltransferase [Desulfurobacterium sp.]
MAKILRDLKKLKELVEDLKSQGKRIVFTNGCFDILHAGHVDYLEKAKSFGDILIVGMNSDDSIRRIKGEKRPIVPESYRARVLVGLRAVDYVFIFTDDTPYEVIKTVKPHVLVKGADWELEKIVGREFAERVERIPFKYDISTTRIIEKIKERYCRDL